MSTKEGQPATKQQINSSDIIVVDPAVIRDAVVLSEDILMLIFSFTDFVTLIRVVQRICMHWKMMVCRTLPFILGSKPFESKEELIGRIQEYCGDKILHADKIARLHGWPIGKWNVSEIDDFEDAFEDQVDFNEDIGELDMSNATSLSWMFYNARSFNQDLSRWNTSKVSNMRFMFTCATSFNGDVTTWDTSKVEVLDGMFCRATAFNQNISSWDVSNDVDNRGMFRGADSFNNDFAPQFLS
mmetsp:Transcript_26903/g.40860  ORF Transcript_26903/g.40860 Transcript_26903/m.40860 type:complete len:242 (-) Transcript_26903:34-759(-)